MIQPLYRQSKDNSLPKYQFMDIETLEWIASNAPVEIKNVDYNPIIKKYGKNIYEAIQFVPKIEWHNNKNVAQGIHGILHIFRVTTYLIILNNELSLNINTILLYVLGMFHDIGRLNDRNDKGHGARSVAWMRRNKRLIENYLGEAITDKNWENVILSISLHDVDKFGNNYSSSQKKYINILKIADALDRYRLPKKTWWLNDKYLSTVPDVIIKAFAFNFIVYTEMNNLKKINLNKSIKCFLQT